MSLVYTKTVDSIESVLCWLLKLQISFAIHLQATHTGFAPENILAVAGLKESKSSFCVILSHCFSFH